MCFIPKSEAGTGRKCQSGNLDHSICPSSRGHILKEKKQKMRLIISVSNWCSWRGEDGACWKQQSPPCSHLRAFKKRFRMHWVYRSDEEMSNCTKGKTLPRMLPWSWGGGGVAVWEGRGGPTARHSCWVLLARAIVRRNKNSPFSLAGFQSAPIAAKCLSLFWHCIG